MSNIPVDTQFYGGEIVLYKTTLFSPGSSMSWYSDKLPNFDNNGSLYPAHTHGVITEVHIPRGCRVDDLVKLLNGMHVPGFFIKNVALFRGDHWEFETRPTAQEVAEQFVEDWRN